LSTEVKAKQFVFTYFIGPPVSGSKALENRISEKMQNIPEMGLTKTKVVVQMSRELLSKSESK